MRDAKFWIEKLGLSPHPEGGYFRETYRAAETLRQAHLPDRSLSTAIFFLLEGRQVSKFHRLKADEVWHFYDGGGLLLHILNPDKTITTVRLGRDGERGETPQTVAPAGSWFGAELPDHSAFVLVGCTVAPGFDFEDFEFGCRRELLRLYPDHRPVIERLTSPATI